jgi:hypothetical protein
MQIVDLSGDEQELRSIQDRMIDAVTLHQQDALDNVELAGHALVAGVERAHRGIAEFLSQKIRDDLDTHRALLRCRSFGEMRDLQVRYLCTAVGQFGDEAVRLMQIGTDIGNEIASRSLERGRL